MTCIVGLVHDGSVYIGGDSVGVAGLNLTPRADRKVFRNGQMLIGFCGSFRMGQLLQYKFVPPTNTGSDIMKYMVTDFVDEVRKCLRDGGYAKEIQKSEQGGFFVVGYRGRLFEIQADYQVAESVDPWIAAGSGREYAYGSLYTTETATEGMTPTERVLTALQAADKYHGGVSGPFEVLRLDGRPKIR